MEYEADERHVGGLARQMGLEAPTVKSVATPGVNEKVTQEVMKS